ncbi:hypothetical protein [Verminephrobacter eiseniae]|nr:hypothetical protein [Verminephrobacter eiseniae]
MSLLDTAICGIHLRDHAVSLSGLTRQNLCPSNGNLLGVSEG